MLTSTSPRPFLRRFGRTGLSFPEIGLEIDDTHEQSSFDLALRLGLRYLRTAAPVPTTRRPQGEELTLAQDVEAAAPLPSDSWSSTDIAVVAAACLGDPARVRVKALEDVEELRHTGAVSAVAVHVQSSADLNAAIAWDVTDAVELRFGVLQQALLLEAHDSLRSWGGAVVARAPADADAHVEAEHVRTELAAWCARQRHLSPERLDGQVSLLPDVVSVVLLNPVNACAGRIAGALPAALLPTSSLRDLDALLRDHGFASDLAAHRAARPVHVRGRAGEEPAPTPQSRTLADAWRLGPLELRNRLVRSGATERAVDDDAVPTPAMRRIHHALGNGGAGLIVTGYLAVSGEGRASTSHGVLSGPAAISAWADLLQECRRTSTARWCAQLGHGGAIALGDADTSDVVSEFQDAARAAEDAGFDAVQLHAAHGYLLGQCLASAPLLRHRPSSHEGRDLVLRVAEAVAEVVGGRLAVMLKMNSSDFIPGGYAQDDALVAVEAVADAVDGVELSGWVPAAPSWRTPSRLGQAEERSEGWFLPFATEVKARHPTLAVGTCGGFRSRRGMTHAIQVAGLDFVALARPLVAEPDLPRKLLAGQQHGYCDGCNQCLAKHVRPLHCPRLATDN